MNHPSNPAYLGIDRDYSNRTRVAEHVKRKWATLGYSHTQANLSRGAVGDPRKMKSFSSYVQMNHVFRL